MVVAAGWLADGSGRPLTPNRFIEIRSGRIRRIRTADRGDRAAPGIVDWSGGMVIPGLIDAHAHLIMSGTPDPVIPQRQLAASYDVLEGVLARHVDQHQSSMMGTLRRMRMGRLVRCRAPVELRNALRAALASWASWWLSKKARRSPISG